jgi:hypothetical protein
MQESYCNFRVIGLIAESSIRVVVWPSISLPRVRRPEYSPLAAGTSPVLSIDVISGRRWE